MPFTAAPGETLLLPTPNVQNKHLFIIITSREPNTNNVIIVGLETNRGRSDTTVILRQGDHPFIQHETSVRYSGAKIVSADTLIQLVDRGIAIPKDPCSPKLLERIRQGLLRSPHTTNEILEHYRNLMWPLK
jgi:hypothetical protein